MPFNPPRDYWLEVPAGRYRVGLTHDEARALARQSAAWMKGEGPEFSLNEGKAISRAAELLDTMANPAWVEAYLLANYPAREVNVPAFAIAKHPIDNRTFRAFMADTGETQPPDSRSRGAANLEDSRPAHGLSWWQAIAIAEWAGARLPFEAEWERAVRGEEHLLFPWGNEFVPIGAKVLREGYPIALPSATTRAPSGLEGAVCRSPEWCADLWSSPTDGEQWGEHSNPTTARVLRGEATKKAIPSAVSRTTP